MVKVSYRITKRILVLFILTLLVPADSVFVSIHAVLYHFNHGGHYVYQAAQFKHPNAIYQVYRQTGELAWLEQAARLNHPQAVLELYRYWQDKQLTSNAQTWLDQALYLKIPEAALMRLQQLVADKQWQQAQLFYQQKKAMLASLSSTLEPKLDQLLAQITVAVSAADELIEHLPFLDRVDITTSPLTTWQQQAQSRQCRLTIQTFTQTAELKQQAAKLSQSVMTSKWQELGICFGSVTVLDVLNSVCGLDQSGRIECQLKKLATFVRQYMEPQTSHLLFVVTEGEANTRGGLMFLDAMDNKEVFIHEMAHWLGYVDEYEIAPQQQMKLCQTHQGHWLGHNIFIAPKTMTLQQVEHQAKQTLYPANTCNGSTVQAYKPFATAGFMEFLDLTVTEPYFRHIQGHMNDREIVPAAMNFALAFQRDDTHIKTAASLAQDNKSYLYWLTKAGSHLYSPALRLLAQHYIQEQKFTIALDYLLYAAQQGDAASQVLLGHGYLEGDWLQQDLTASAYWYQQAALQQDDFGLYFYGKCHEMGWGCSLLKEKAYQLYKQAAQLGNELAQQKLRQFDLKID